MTVGTKPWVVKSAVGRPRWAQSPAEYKYHSCIKLGTDVFDDGTIITSYLVTVILRDEKVEPPKPYVIEYDNGAYDVVTCLSSIPVPRSSQLTFTVVRNARGPGQDPPPPP
ncbi:MAG TPA: hypothetical protein VEJ89_13505 [Myxococcaceae bacterium]|jgi:hypothetical protein|nr:hypothetical protein [Myxococcaceae bacterium]